MAPNMDATSAQGFDNKHLNQNWSLNQNLDSTTYFENLRLDFNFFLHSYNGHVSWQGMIGGLLGFIYLT